MKTNQKLILVCLMAAMMQPLLFIAQIPTGGLVGDWPFDGNANDYSDYGNNGTVYGATPTMDRFNNPNHAYEFNGTSNKIIVPNSSTVDMSDNTDFTIACWIKINANNSNGLPLCKNIYGSWSGYLFYTNNTNPGYCTLPQHLSFYVAPNSNGDACSDSALFTVGKVPLWHFITGV